MRIRRASQADDGVIRGICLDAFDDDEKESVADLSVDLLFETTSPEIFMLLAEVQDVPAGYVSFSPATSESSEEPLGYILAPLAVKKAFQRKGIGSALVRHGLEFLKQQGWPIGFVYGDPKYYSRFGFVPDIAEGYTVPYPLRYPFGWQAISFNSPLPAPGPIECVKALSKPELW
jgi:putative acetyltransferase